MEISASMEMPPEYYQHAESLEAFRLALLENAESESPIPFSVCLTAWASLIFCHKEFQRITAAADVYIDSLRAEVDLSLFEKIKPLGSA